MKKRGILVVLMMVCVVFATSAEGFNFFDYSPVVKNAGSIFDIGVGFGGYGFDVHAAYDKVVPIAAGDKTLPLSFGGMADLSFKEGINISVIARAAWHVDVGIPALDVYFGPAVGVKILGIGHSQEIYNYYSGRYETYYPDPVVGPDIGGAVGAHWAFSDTMAAFLEFGYTGLTYTKLGVSFIL